MKTPRNENGFNPWEQATIDRADTFVACRFEGRGRYTRRQAPTLNEALALGEGLRCADRGVMIYAVAGRSQTLVTTLGPRR